MRKTALADQVVVITGASYGLGRAIAREAARGGAKVVAAARTGEALDAFVAEAEALGAEAIAVECDVANLDDVHRVVERAVDRFGRIDTYVANQMVTVYAEAEQLEPDELRRVLDVNFFGSVHGFWAALPHLKETRGTFVQIASALSYRGIPLQAAYCASKGALRNFFESARTELDKHETGVDVVVILPGAINTPQFDRGRQKLGLQPQPVPPIYQPEPFAKGVVHTFEHPVRELPLGWGAQKLLWGQKLSPRAGDLVLLRTGWKAQTTGLPKPVDSPDNLFHPLPGDPGAHGRFDDVAKGSTLWTSLRLRRWLVGGAALAVAAAPVARRLGRTG